MNGRNNLQESVKPIYEFDWGDHSRRTDELNNGDKLGTAGVELLKEFGGEDPECEVSLIGYAS